MMSLESNCGTKKFRRIRKEFGSRNIRKLIPFENNTLYGIAYHSIHSTGVNDHYCCQDFLMINHYFIYTINIKYTPYIIHTHCQLIKSNKSGIDATGIRIFKICSLLSLLCLQESGEQIVSHQQLLMPVITYQLPLAHQPTSSRDSFLTYTCIGCAKFICLLTRAFTSPTRRLAVATQLSSLQDVWCRVPILWGGFMRR